MEGFVIRGREPNLSGFVGMLALHPRGTSHGALALRTPADLHHQFPHRTGRYRHWVPGFLTGWGIVVVHGVHT